MNVRLPFRWKVGQRRLCGRKVNKRKQALESVVHPQPRRAAPHPAQRLRHQVHLLGIPHHVCGAKGDDGAEQ